MEIVKKKAEKIKAKRLVIDPITALTLQYDDISERRTATLDLFETLQKLGTTNLITTELRRAALEREIRAEEYLAHGVIVLHVVVNNGQIVRGIQIEKMRGIPHDNQIRPYEIARKGISVFPQDKLFGNITSVSTSLQPFTVLSIT
jgi:KaiC/GvpD/RAD55 family RecA-like ATPase